MDSSSMMSVPDSASSEEFLFDPGSKLVDAEQVAMALAQTVAKKDGYSREDLERTADYAVLLGAEVGLNADQLENLRLGTLLHKIGKIAIPDTLLDKTGALSPREKELFHQHPKVAFDICSPLTPLQDVLPIIRSHKEHWDGTGYPDGLQGDEIPIGAQIVGIVGIYSALTNDRPFRKALSHGEAVERLRERGDKGRHDPQLVERFVECMERQYGEFN